MVFEFLTTLKSYSIEIFWPLLFGFLASGVINELIPGNWIQRYLGRKGILPILSATVVGTIAPVCCWGSLPIAVSFHKKGASLGAIFAFLAATPATSVSALFVSWKFLGSGTTLYIASAVIIMGVVLGLIGNLFKVTPKETTQKEPCCHTPNETADTCQHCHDTKSLKGRIISVVRYAFITMPKEIGFEIIVGLILAALVATLNPIGLWIKNYLAGGFAYLFALIVGLVMYVCSTMSVPLVHALIKQGMNAGAALSFLILGPIASFGTILVLRKKFGVKILIVFIGSVSVLSLLLGYLYTKL